jgi:hypothetical protein
VSKGQIEFQRATLLELQEEIAKPTMTLKYYSHWLPRADKSFADRLDSAAARPAEARAVSAA